MSDHNFTPAATAGFEVPEIDYGTWSQAERDEKAKALLEEAKADGVHLIAVHGEARIADIAERMGVAHPTADQGRGGGVNARRALPPRAPIAASFSPKRVRPLPTASAPATGPWSTS